jgi:protein-S-isoprenylcysteine O-methyltransferase Ste14
MTTATHTPWWRGTRGEWYIVAQTVFIALVFIGPRQFAGWPSWPFPSRAVCLGIGIVFLLPGMAIFLAGLRKLGSNLTPLPHPKENATLVETGPYRFVRHPIYSGGILLSFGWAFFTQGWFTFVYSVLLLVLFDIKSRREEKCLTDAFPSYPDYQRRVRKFIPFIY